MGELVVMRHAKSDWDSGAASDFDRPLSRRGHNDAPRMAQWLDDNDLKPDRVLSSAAVRARRTAGYVIEYFDMADADTEFSDELYLADADTWLDALADQSADRILICGHNPGLDWLVDTLSRVPPTPTADGKLMTTAAIAHLVFDTSWAKLGPGSADLQHLVRPRDL